MKCNLKKETRVLSKSVPDRRGESINVTPLPASLARGLTFSNELISRDEGMHCDFACHLYSTLRQPLDTARLHAIVADAVVIEVRRCRLNTSG